MRELGISIYPFHSKMEDNKAYVDLASKYGFTRCFMCLLSVEHSKEDIIKEFSTIINYAKDRGIYTTLDISPAVFKHLDISYDNLEFFYKLGAWGIRLDLGFSGNEESLMTYNDYNLKIELNMSNSTSYIDTIMNYYPNRENLIGCYNFYPHAYSGLDKKLFIESMNRFKKHSIKSSAFVNAKEASFGPWPVDDGICTLEEHRNLPKNKYTSFTKICLTSYFTIGIVSIGLAFMTEYLGVYNYDIHFINNGAQKGEKLFQPMIKFTEPILGVDGQLVKPFGELTQLNIN